MGIGKTANLPVTMVAELELNSVIPSPDTIEEESLRIMPQASPRQAKATQNLS